MNPHDASVQSPPSMLRKVTIGATAGSVVEWYDIAVYGYLAVIIGKVFFAATDPTSALLSSFAVFALAFAARPFGGIVFGILGDRIGRRRTLTAVILMVSLSTVAIGVIPGYATIGIAAPILLVLCRLLQGFSAGGELGGASAFVFEHSPDRSRGYRVSLVEMGAILGFLVGSALVLLLNLAFSNAQMLSWGWRIPFLLSGVLGAIGLYIRSRTTETPQFQALQDQDVVSRSPLREAVTHHWRAMLSTAGYSLFHNGALYVILVFIPSYQTKDLKYTSALASTSSVISLAVICLLIPVMGAVSDRFGRRVVLGGGCVIAVITSYPLFVLMGTSNPTFAVLAQVGLGIYLAIFLGASLVAMNELFPTRVRYVGMSLGYNISVSAFGGTAPFLVTLLLSSTGSLRSPAYFIIVLALITLAVVACTRETAPRLVPAR